MAQDFGQGADDFIEIDLNGEKHRVARRDVFLSYDHKAPDRAALDVAQRIADALENAGYSVWWDRMMLSGDWEQQLELHARAAHRIVSLETVRYHEPERTWCRREFEIGLQEGKLARFRVDRAAEPPAAVAELAAKSQIIDVDLEDPRLGFVVAKNLGFAERHTEAREKTEAVDITALPVTTRLVGRIGELRELRSAWEDGIVNVAVLHAIGGAGKSAILYQFAQDILTLGGASKVYGWSAYSQGSGENSNADADGFISNALRFFGGDPGALTDSHARAKELAKRVAAERALLLIDGLEPLQSPPHVNMGRLKSKPMAALIKSLSSLNEGLCIITSRQPLPELPNSARVLDTPLDRLTKQDGAALLLRSGATGPMKRLEAAVDGVNGHALSVKLLGTYASSLEGGRIEAAEAFGFKALHEVAGLSPDQETARFAEKANKVVTSYLERLDELDKTRGQGVPERAILHIVGLFDRPADGPAVRALLSGEPIPGMTSELYQRFEIGAAGLSERELSAGEFSNQWSWAKKRLRSFGLLGGADPKDKDALDAHPIVRAYFKERLKTVEPEAYREAHRRLYQHYSAAAPDLPDTLSEMQPLLHAIPHGVEAGCIEEAFDEIYYRRVRRGNKSFILKKLGAFEADLAALAAFFVDPWRQPRPGLPKQAQSVLLNYAAFALRGLGRLAEAVDPFEARIERAVDAKDDKGAAINAGNLSELLLTLGRIEAANKAGAQSVEYADLSRDAFHRMGMRTTHADSLHQAGRLKEALALFEEAERLQAERQPTLPKLYSTPGYNYGDLLLSNGRTAEVQARYEYLVQAREDEDPLLDRALEELLAARTQAALALREATRAKSAWSLFRRSPPPDSSTTVPEHIAAARLSFDAATEELRRADREDHLPKGLIARAAFYRWRAALGEEGAAVRMTEDLDEAEEIARYGGMKLYLADIALERARFAKAQGDQPALKRYRQEAADLIKECGYGRRLPELKDL